MENTQPSTPLQMAFCRPGVVLIDVGCCAGHFLKKIPVPRDNYYAVGVDPWIRVGGLYNEHHEVALDETEGAGVLNLYHDMGSSSLLRMREEIIVHTHDRPGWFIRSVAEGLTGERVVQRVRGDSLFGKFDHIDYLKIDAQGMDMAVVRGFGALLERVRFIQIESVTSHDPQITLYEGQSIFEDDIVEMDRLGFDVVSMTDYSEYASPEADVVFRNRRIV